MVTKFELFAKSAITAMEYDFFWDAHKIIAGNKCGELHIIDIEKSAIWGRL